MGRGKRQEDQGTSVTPRLEAPAPKPSPPNTLARTIAGVLWPSVQSQTQIAEGVYGFHCAGHGGVVAVVGKADLPEAAVEAARRQGMIEVVVEDHRGHLRRLHSVKYVADSLRRAAEGAPERYTLTELWVGEEDCDWATIFHSNPDLIQKSIDAGHHGPGLDAAAVRGSVERWNEAFLAELDPDYVPIPGGQLEKLRRHEELLDSGAFIRQSATRNPEGLTEVLFRDKAGNERTYTMSPAVYDQMPLGEDATPGDYREIGEITLVSA